jgi:hypothetical protein
MLVTKRVQSFGHQSAQHITDVGNFRSVFVLNIQITLCNIPSELKPCHHLFTCIKLRARNIPNFSVFTVSENTYSFIRVKIALEEAPVQKEIMVLKIVVIKGLQPQSPRHFARQPTAQVSPILRSSYLSYTTQTNTSTSTAVV